MALREGDVDPATVVHVNAHATSTPKGDIAEGLMLHAVLGEHVDRCVVTSTKSMTGHLLGGAGALEAIATVLALHDRVSPPTINLDDKDPEVDLDIPTSRARPPGRRHRRPQQLLRLRRRQRGRRLREPPMTATAARPAKLPREDDPRNPVHRLTALLDEGTFELITPDDDSGMLAAVGRVDGTSVVAFCTDATVMGGAMGDVGCRVVVDAYHRAITDGVPIIGLWHSGGARLARGRAVAPRRRPHLPRHDAGLGRDPADLGRPGPGCRRRRLRSGPHRRRHPRSGGTHLRHRPRRGALGDRRGRRHAPSRRTRAPRTTLRRGPHPHRVRARGPRPRPHRRLPARRAGQPGRRRRWTTATSAPCCRSRRSAPTTCTRSSTACSTRAPCRSSTPAGRPTSSRRWAASAAAPSASWPTTRCASAAASTRCRRRRRPASCGCATRSACRSSSWSTSRATCPAWARSGTASYAAARSCCTPSVSAWSLGSPW